MYATALKTTFSFVRRIQAQFPDHIFLVRAKDISGKPAWYYVQAHYGKRDAFKAKSGSPFVKLTDYGRIIESGFGNEPPTDIKFRMERNYGFKE
jgi:hypothetical protein